MRKMDSDLETPSTSTIDEWLRSIGLGKYLQLFIDNDIAFNVLPHLTEEDVDGLNLPIGARRRVLVELKKLADRFAQRYVDDSEVRYLTVVFCDLVGSTELFRKLDLEERKNVLNAYRLACDPIVARYEGDVENYAGDGIRIFFGLPVAHEDDARRSVHAGLDMIEAVQRIPFSPQLAVRIGIASGPVVVEREHKDAAGSRAYGEALHLAERLQGVAQPNQVVVSAATQRLLGSTFELEDLGPNSLKGFIEPVPAWRVVGIGRTPSRFEAIRSHFALTPLIGRAAEIEMLAQCWQAACNGQGRVVLISGDPGVGKSRMTRALSERIEGGTNAALQYQCSPFHTRSALHPVIQQIEITAGFSRDDTAHQKLDKLLAILPPGGGSEERYALLAATLGLPAERFSRLNMSPRRQKDRTLQMLVEQVEAMSLEKPVLMVFEDVHWVDPTTKEALDILIERVRSVAVLVLITFRPEFTPPWAGLPHVASIMLDRLDRIRSQEMVRMVANQTTLSRPVMERITERADGVPLFIEELTRSVLEAGTLGNAEVNAGQGVSTSGALIPATLQESLLARLDRLSREKHILQIAACIGRAVPYRLLARISAFEDEALSLALERLTDAGIVFSNGNPGEATYTFKHALLQDAAYESLLKSRRQRIHAEIAEAYEEDLRLGASIPPEILAHHYTESRNLDAAIPMWRQAGELAMRNVAYLESVSHFRRGLELLSLREPGCHRDELELSIRQPLNGSLIASQGWAAEDVKENAAAILRIAEHGHSPQSLLVGLYGVWISTLTQGHVADALGWAERLLAEGRTTGDLDLHVLGHTACMITYFYLGQLRDAQEHGVQADALYDPSRAERWVQLTGHDTRSVYLGWRAHWTWMLGYPDQAAVLSDQKDAHARSLDHALDLGYALTVGAYPLDYRCEPEALFRRVREADRIGREHAIPVLYEVMVPQVEGLARLRAKQFSQAIVLLREGIEHWKRLNGGTRLPYLQAALAEALFMQGEHGLALETVDKALAQIEDPTCQERCHLAEVLRVRGWILMQLGRDDEAEDCLRRSIEWAREQHAKSWELRSATTLATLLVRRGQPSFARDLLSPVCNWFTEGLDTHDVKVASKLLKSLH